MEVLRLFFLLYQPICGRNNLKAMPNEKCSTCQEHRENWKEKFLGGKSHQPYKHNPILEASLEEHDPNQVGESSYPHSTTYESNRDEASCKSAVCLNKCRGVNFFPNLATKQARRVFK